MMIIRLLVAMLTLAGEPQPATAQKYQLVVFHAKWCRPCKQIADHFKSEEFAAAMDDHSIEKWYYVDTDQSPEVTQSYRVESVPTLVLISMNSDGTCHIVRRHIGSLSKNQLVKFLADPKD